MRKTFLDIQTIDQLNAVNDAQKAGFQEQVQSSADTAAFVEERQSSYLARWREALAYVRPGAALLDIGSGWPIPRVWDAVVRDHRVNYHALDVSPGEIEETKRWLSKFGLPPEHAVVGSNTDLPFSMGHFDFVFSSHCLEHSADLARTFEEITRVLKPDGTLFFAVPFGFDASNEHLLYFSIEEWLKLTELAGFKVINIHVGRIYSPFWDVAIVARPDLKSRNLDVARRMVTRNSKANLTFISGLEDAFQYSGPILPMPSHKVLTKGAVATLSAGDVLTILFLQNNDSGAAEISTDQETKIVDLYSPFNTVGSVHIKGNNIKIRSIGHGKGGDQVIIEGALSGKHSKPIEDRVPLWRRIRRRAGRVARGIVRV
jgi:SAM-dependent methyltransferase